MSLSNSFSKAAIFRLGASPSREKEPANEFPRQSILEWIEVTLHLNFSPEGW